MGGLALKNTYTRRYSREEFDIVSKELVEKLNNYFQKVAIPLFYRNKESFGDIDIIISMDNSGVHTNMDTFINAVFAPNEIFHNGNCWSFDYKEIQVDLITCSEEDFESNYHYLAYNDLGNMMGRIAQKLGLKYGQEGFWYNHYYKDQKIGKIMVSKNFPKIFEFLGFDYNRWLEGFDTLEDIFDYVATSPYFDCNMFALEHLNKINRERNAKRKSYMSFLDYISENYGDREFQFEEKSVYVSKANRVFPDARITENMRRLEYIEAKKLYIKSKFGGAEVMRRYGVKGKELGDLLKGFQNRINIRYDIGYDDFILETPTEEIHKAFEDYYKSI
jgi:hypothetical protein